MEKLERLGCRLAGKVIMDRAVVIASCTNPHAGSMPCWRLPRRLRTPPSRASSAVAPRAYIYVPTAVCGKAGVKPVPVARQGERPIFRVGDLSVDLVRRIVKVGQKEGEVVAQGV